MSIKLYSPGGANRATVSAFFDMELVRIVSPPPAKGRVVTLADAAGLSVTPRYELEPRIPVLVGQVYRYKPVTSVCPAADLAVQPDCACSETVLPDGLERP